MFGSIRAPLRYGIPLFVLAAACYPPQDKVVEEPQTKALFKALNSVPNGRITVAEMQEPLYPVSVPSVL